MKRIALVLLPVIAFILFLNSNREQHFLKSLNSETFDLEVAQETEYDELEAQEGGVDNLATRKSTDWDTSEPASNGAEQGGEGLLETGKQWPLIQHTTSRFQNVTASMYMRKALILRELSFGKFQPKNNTLTSTNDWTPNTARAKQVFAYGSSRQNLRTCMASRRMFVFGTSFQRSLFWSIVRQLLPPEDGDTLPPDLQLIASVPALIREIPPGETKCNRKVNGFLYTETKLPFPTERPSCLLVKHPECEYPGPAGIDSNKCGMPQSKPWKNELGTVILYQFKTYISAPAVDRRIFSIMRQSRPRNWDVVFIESGEWGSWQRASVRGRTTFEEAREFLSSCSRIFKGWIIVSGNSEYTEQNRLFMDAARQLSGSTSRLLVFGKQPA